MPPSTFEVLDQPMGRSKAISMRWFGISTPSGLMLMVRWAWARIAL